MRIATYGQGNTLDLPCADTVQKLTQGLQLLISQVQIVQGSELGLALERALHVLLVQDFSYRLRNVQRGHSAVVVTMDEKSLGRPKCQ
jgi:hypothetical protein